MARVLISFLGTGTAINSKADNTEPVHDKEPREYRKANYYINDKCLGEYTFVSLALRKEYKADKAIMIGTVRSMWEEVYMNLRKNADSNYQPADDAVYFDIADHCENSNHKSELYLPHKDKIEKELGKDSHVVLIKYGLNESEVIENINIILSLEKFIQNGDEIIIDITHGFRSLPILITQLLMYLKTISKKDITISHVFYGMLDITKEMNGKTPIVDLTSVLNINDWIIGAYSLQNYGNGVKVSELIEDENKSVSQLIYDFSNAMSLNHIMAIQSQVQRLDGIRNIGYSSKVPELILAPTIDEFVQNFRNSDKQSKFEMKLAEWQIKHHNYAAAYISLIEAVISYVCENNNLNPQDENDRNNAKGIIFDCKKKSWEYHNIRKEFTKINNNRKKVAHALDTDNSIIAMINELKQGVDFFKNIII